MYDNKLTFHKNVVALSERVLREQRHVSGAERKRQSGAGRDVTRRGEGGGRGCGAHARRFKVTLNSQQVPASSLTTFLSLLHDQTVTETGIRLNADTIVSLCPVEFMTAPCGLQRFSFITFYLSPRD